jgi:hypothetical protein
LWLCACGGATVTKPIQPTREPEKDTFAALRARLQVVADGSHYVAYIPPKANVGGKADGALLFTSVDGKTFDQVDIDDVVDDESDAWTISFIDPRFPVPAGELRLEKGEIIASCRGREKRLSASTEGGQRVLGGAPLHANRQIWTTVAMGRDTAGTLYYVDAGSGESNRDQVRLFLGKPGALKEVPLLMTDKRDWPNLRLVTAEGMLKVEVDSRGKLPSTTLWWTVSGRTSKVLVQDVDKQGTNPWSDLGIYADRRGSTPCDIVL